MEAPYNRTMLSDLQALMAPAVLERLTLLANHVLGREPAAMQRLRAHQGAVLQVIADPWPALLPKPPAVSFRITPAGLLEWCPQPEGLAPNLRVVVDAANPLAVALRLASGHAPAAQVEGDSRLAGDVDWLFAHVRWDLVDDLEAAFGPAVAQSLGVVGQTLRTAMDSAARRAADLAGRFGKTSP
jgi:ubiquinone biosynthesis accessory factor UbiJ